FGGAPLLEFRDIGAGHESPAAGAADNDHPDRVVLFEIVHDLGHGLPHFERHGIVARRVVEDQTADRAVLLGDHLAGRQRLVEHAWLLLYDSMCAVIASGAKQPRAGVPATSRLLRRLRLLAMTLRSDD